MTRRPITCCRLSRYKLAYNDLPVCPSVCPFSRRRFFSRLVALVLQCCVSVFLSFVMNVCGLTLFVTAKDIIANRKWYIRN